MENKNRTFQKLVSLTTAATMSLLMTACDQGKNDDNPPPKPAPDSQSQDKNKDQSQDQSKGSDQQQAKDDSQKSKDQQAQSGTDQKGKTESKPNQQTAANEPKPSASSSPSYGETGPGGVDQSTFPPPEPKIPVPSKPVPGVEAIPTVLTSSDAVTTLFTQLFAENHPEAIEKVADGLVDEVYAREGESQGKIVELQASVAKLDNKGIYSPEMKNRVAYLQAKIDNRVHSGEYRNFMDTGVLIAGTGLVLATATGAGLYRYIPEIGPALGRRARAGAIWVGDTSKELYTGGRRMLSAVTNRENIAWAARGTRDGIIQAPGKAWRGYVHYSGRMVEAGKRPFRAAEVMVRENLQDLGLTAEEQGAITELRRVGSFETRGVEFARTPKSTFKYGVLGTWEGQPLGLDRMLVFKQQRLVRGSPLQTTFVSNPIPADVAGSIVSRLAVQESERSFVHFVNLRTGAMTALRWPADQFVNLMKYTGSKVKPLFATFDVPTAVGTGVATAGTMGVAYWYGYDNGKDAAREEDAANLEAMIRQPPAAITSSLQPGGSSQ